MKIETLIGDVDESNDNFGAGQWIECPVQNEHVVGFEIDVNSNGGPPSYLYFGLCNETA